MGTGMGYYNMSATEHLGLLYGRRNEFRNLTGTASCSNLHGLMHANQMQAMQMMEAAQRASAYHNIFNGGD